MRLREDMYTWRSYVALSGAHKLLVLLTTVVYILKLKVAVSTLVDEYWFIHRWMETVLTCSILSFRGQYSGVTEFENMMPSTVDGTGTATLTFSENISADDFYTVTITIVQEPETGEMSEFQQIMRETNISKIT